MVTVRFGRPRCVLSTRAGATLINFSSWCFWDWSSLAIQGVEDDAGTIIVRAATRAHPPSPPAVQRYDPKAPARA